MVHYRLDKCKSLGLDQSKPVCYTTGEERPVIYLCEREIGFDAAGIGFPSIDGCRAVVLVTAGGLIGFHLNGTLSQTKKDNFVNFVNAQVAGVAKRRLYVASRMGGNGLTPTQCYDEIKSLAEEFHFSRSIYFADVTSVNGGSVYIEFQNNGNHSCDITAKVWSDADATQGTYVAAGRATANGAANANMVTLVNPAGAAQVNPTTFDLGIRVKRFFK